MANITIEGADDFRQEVVFSSTANQRIRNEAWAVVQGNSKELRTRIKSVMPVDYGDARDRWGNPAHIMRRPWYKGAPGRGIWREDRGKLELEQGAALEPYEYIKRLNEGHSRQAPAGFIDMTVEQTLDKFSEGIVTAVLKVFQE